MGIIGTVLGVLALVAWGAIIVLAATSDSSTDDSDSNEQYFDTIRLAGSLAGALGRLIG